ncbi:MAG: thioredoxin domain-containing protein [Rhodobacteraceae bacterium]|nr:thioredoxin domain-containing protein [Paracoccaceae bacterium]
MKTLTLIALLFASPLVAQEREPNNLLGEASPYLLQHVYNAVDWYPWGEAAFEEARATGKPIFISVGYASCHWCRVMAQESFENEEIGTYLNENFVSIKLDREERPDLDEQFMLVTQNSTGGGGWPNTVFLTPEGEPFFGGGYYPPEAFTALLEEMNSNWRNDRAQVNATAAALGAVVREYLDRKARARLFTADMAREISSQMLGQMDDFNGGFGVAPKFPLEPRLLYLLDQADRNADQTLLEAVQLAAEGMVNGGIQDHAGGGFHRYAVDNEWGLPHFEKMLYNQALIGRLLLRLDALQSNEDFARAARRTFDYVLREMQAPDGGFYATQDADSPDDNGVFREGIYYTWAPSQIREVAGVEAEFLIKALNVEEDGNFEGRNTLRLSYFDGDRARLDAGLEQLRLARLARNAPPTDKKVLMGWNGEMIVTLAQAARAYDRPEYLAAAQASARFIMENMRNGEGYFRSYITGAARIEAQLPDYAGFGRGLVALHDIDPDGGWLIEAARIARFMLDNLHEDGGVFRMSEQVEGLGVFIPLDDGEVASGNAQAQRLLTALARRGEDVVFIQQAAALADILSGNALGQPEERAAALAAVDAQNRGDVGPLRALSNGVVQVWAKIDREAYVVNFTINVAEGWHINAHEPLEDYFIPTALWVNGVELGREAYPKPLITTLAFNSDTPLALYDGELRLSAPVSSGVNVINLVLQSCSDEICLAPQNISFSFWQ